MENAATVNHLNCRAKGGTAGYKVATLGAAGGIGQHLAMLMKMNPLVSVLHLYDVVNTPNVTSYISQMDTDVIMRWFLGQQQLDEALTGMELVIIPASVPRKPGMTRDDEIESYDGFVISGSSRHAHGNDAWICRLLTLFQKLDSIKKKVLGICFDHQILSRAMRGKSGRAMGYRNPNRPLVTIIQGLLLSQRSSSSLHI